MARELADAHYNRQSVGAKDFVPPGRCLVLYARTPSGTAFWVTSFQFRRYVKHAYPGAWICSAFRNETAALSSMLIVQAVACTRHQFGPSPPHGMITFIDPKEVLPKDQPGWCFLKAGFRRVGFTDKGLIVLQLMPDLMPAASPPLPSLEPRLVW